MANLKEIRTRISSVQSTRQITSAMKMVSAAKLRKAQDSIIQIRPYANKLQEILHNLTDNLDNEVENIYGTEREIKKILFVIITSNKGLCGGFNSNVVKKTTQLINEDYKYLYSTNNIDLITIGKKGSDLLKTKGYTILERHDDLLDNLTFENVHPLIKQIMDAYVSGSYDAVRIIYNQFKNAAVQTLSDEQFLPISFDTENEELDDFEETHFDYILEPTKEYIIQEIIPKSLKIQFYKTLLDSVASEHGARMTAMHKATDNATELIKDLQLEYNKARQASITNEILEIVSGAEALKG